MSTKSSLRTRLRDKLRLIMKFTPVRGPSVYEQYQLSAVRDPGRNETYPLALHITRCDITRTWGWAFLGTTNSHEVRVYVTEPGDNAIFYERTFGYPVDDQALIDGAIYTLEADPGWAAWIRDRRDRRLRQQCRSTSYEIE